MERVFGMNRSKISGSDRLPGFHFVPSRLR